MTNLERLKRDAQTWTALFFSVAAIGIFFSLAAAGSSVTPMGLIASVAAVVCTVGGIVSSILLVATLVADAYRKDALSSQSGGEKR